MPRYFAKFSQSHRSEDQWFHFTASKYPSGSFEFKLHVIKLKLIYLIKSLYRF